jgi:hypothetical protein
VGAMPILALPTAAGPGDALWLAAIVVAVSLLGAAVREGLARRK